MQPTHADIAAAVERRLQQERLAAEAAASVSGHGAAFDADHERRQEFRRLIDPGILRPNARELALESLQILKTLAENILEHPGEAKYQRFKPTNAKIKRLLVQPKGTLEYAVENFQPFYVFHKQHMSDVKIALAIINETLEREIDKKEREERAKREVKGAEAAAKEKVRLLFQWRTRIGFGCSAPLIVIRLQLKRQFLDDRKSQALRQQREREAREAIASVQRTSPSSQPDSGQSTRRTSRMGSVGQTLDGQVVYDERGLDHDVPPPYDGSYDDDD
ncbi:uncharacterized protein LAESUDRAFT_655501 [Laetiporus sulphureus 93-53]|uniref:Uncharacterized protein n=1 Tax=Laetiporus sulphureus 93-53 TaxID=1314785 RepID=A0A165DS41_9APHY|nr:uncharacterized protein LAESUDRAFT_655501 [Laetiporus sulphureus 93-53]KZT05516.1 hypothetical protein LAESUDRAFT_655501 [Laetiporus sulphureus 93-53]